jgi:hypothetical protein
MRKQGLEGARWVWRALGGQGSEGRLTGASQEVAKAARRHPWGMRYGYVTLIIREPIHSAVLS